jgi:exodeoxyribonuclease VII small subunit
MDPFDQNPEQLSFEELVAALELLTDRLASGQIGIEEAADLYERAELLHGLASQRLARVQARIEALGGHGGAPRGGGAGSGAGGPAGGAVGGGAGGPAGGAGGGGAVSAAPNGGA